MSHIPRGETECSPRALASWAMCAQMRTGATQRILGPSSGSKSAKGGDRTEYTEQDRQYGRAPFAVMRGLAYPVAEFQSEWLVRVMNDVG